MRTITIDVPFGLTIILRTRLPGRLSIDCAARDSESSGSNVTSSTRVSRPRFERILVDIPPDYPNDTFPNTMVPVGLERSTSRTSVRTEVAYSDDWDFADWMPYFQEHGIKVRDFCFEPFPTSQKALEIFDPCIALLKYERMVKMSTKEIRQLYAIRWLTEEQARSRLPPGERLSFAELDNHPSDYPWTRLKLKRPYGTRDEIIAALRRHLKHTYHLDENDFRNIEFDGNIVDPEHSPTVLDIYSQNVDIEMGDASSDAIDSTVISSIGREGPHTSDYLFSAQDDRSPACQRRHLSTPSGVNVETRGSLSSTAYTTASQSPTLRQTTSIQKPPVILSSVESDTIVSEQKRPRGLARTQTLRTF